MTNHENEIPRSSVHPDLHEKVQALLAEDDLTFSFTSPDKSGRHIKEHDTSINGTFVCVCKHSWGSKCVAVTIRKYLGSRYSAVVFNQRCKICHRVAIPELHACYEQRVSRRLKIWSGIHVPAPILSDIPTAEHRKEFCEGCKANRCGGNKKEKTENFHVSVAKPTRKDVRVERHEPVGEREPNHGLRPRASSVTDW